SRSTPLSPKSDPRPSIGGNPSIPTRSRRQIHQIRRSQRSEREKMVRVATFFGMTFGAFLFWESMDKVHVWIALHQDEKQERMEREMEIKKMQADLIAQAKESES
uniref:Uncharacterized protein n=5 Tax=Triticinae TaxID=1648030 RepID=A0A453G8M7_AEGTS